MLHCVIMAGGSGTRFWPQSRKHQPKQLLNIVGEKTMIRATVERVLPLIPFDRMLVVTGGSHEEKIRAQLPEIDSNSVVAEPIGRNTAPCIALAAYKLRKIDPEGVMAALPADHLIGQEREFIKALQSAYNMALETQSLITFGVIPDRPETGYGYIQRGEVVSENDGFQAYKALRFVEKPDLKTAQSYLAKGDYLWNSGMFVWKISTIIEAFERYLPALSRAMENVAPALNTDAEAEAVNQLYEELPDISIDYGILERSEHVLVIPIDVGWNDVGSWTSLQNVWNTDEDGNAVKGQTLSLRSSGCVVSSPQKLTALVGVQDLIIVDTPDAILVCRKDSAQDIKQLQILLRERGYQGLL